MNLSKVCNFVSYRCFEFCLARYDTSIQSGTLGCTARYTHAHIYIYNIKKKEAYIALATSPRRIKRGEDRPSPYLRHSAKASKVVDAFDL